MDVMVLYEISKANQATKARQRGEKDGTKEKASTQRKSTVRAHRKASREAVTVTGPGAAREARMDQMRANAKTKNTAGRRASANVEIDSPGAAMEAKRDAMRSGALKDPKGSNVKLPKPKKWWKGPKGVAAGVGAAGVTALGGQQAYVRTKARRDLEKTGSE